MNEDVTDDNHSSISASGASPMRVKKRKGILTQNDIELGDVLKSIHKMCDASKSTPSINNTQEKKKKGIEHMSLDEL